MSAQPQAAPAVTVALPNRNGRSLLEIVLPSIFAQRHPDFEVVIVDDASTDDSVDYLRREWPAVRVIALEENIGISAAINRCWQNARGEYVALLNNDVELDPDWLATLAGELDRNPRVGSATGKTLSFHQRELLDGAGDQPTWAGSSSRRGFGEPDLGQYDQPESVFSACGGMSLFRRSAFERVGGFDEAFWAYLDDVDWGFRARLAGYDCRYVPAALAFHMGSETLSRDTDRAGWYDYLQRRNGLSMVLKNWPASALLRHGHSVARFQLVWAARGAREGHLPWTLRAWGATLTGLPTTLRQRREIQRNRAIGRRELERLIAPRKPVRSQPAEPAALAKPAALGKPSVLVKVQGRLDDSMSGPEIRGWATARALSERFEVTAAVVAPESSHHEGIRLVSADRRTLLREAPRHDAVVAPELPPYLLARLHDSDTVMVSDQFDPVELEHATLGAGAAVSRRVMVQKAMRRLQLRFADVIVSAGDAQRGLLEQELAGLPERRDPPLLTNVAFGLPDPPAAAGARPLRKRFPAIRADDTLVLWWGSMWRWLDAGTAVRALARIGETRDDVKLVLTAGGSPEPGRDRFSMAAETRELARSLGVLDRTVFFLEDWVPYAERHEYLADADVGITLHLDTDEAPVAARARYLDYLWGGLPCVLGRGDEAAARFAEAGFATLVESEDADGVAAALLRWADHPELLHDARAAGGALAEEFRWPALMAPLADTLDRALAARRGRSARRLRPALAAGGYYARRLHERGAARLSGAAAR